MEGTVFDGKLPKWKWYDYVRYYGFYYWWNWLSDRPRKIKSFFQRGWRGWADEDTWNYDMHLAKIIKEGLIYFKKNAYTLPYNLSEKEWHEALDIIINTFDLLYKVGEGDIFMVDKDQWTQEWYDGMKKTCDELNAKYGGKDRPITKDELQQIEKGIELFGKYYFGLSD